MLRVRNFVIVGLATGSVGLAIACSDSSSSSSSGGTSSGSTSSTSSSSSSGASSTSSSSGGSAFKDCSGSNTSSGGSNTCTDAELKPYSDCVLEKCDPKYKECYGADYKTGNFAGPCGTYITCVQKCACNDVNCVLACQPEATCKTCLEGMANCSDGCTLPACATTTRDAGNTGGKTCADLTVCCQSKEGQIKTTCEQAAASGNDTVCSASYTALQCTN